MRFAEELNQLLPADLPNRDRVVEKASRHLESIVETNRHFNLTRILDPREAAIKHVLDSVIPWRRFASFSNVLDAGTGAGFPGIPLAIVLPELRFTLAESIGKKARFVESVVSDLELGNVKVLGRRAEELLRGRPTGAITARAVAPVARAADLFGPALTAGCKALLYKGPDAETEIAEAAPELRKRGLLAKVVERYTLPDNSGTRTLVEIIASR